MPSSPDVPAQNGGHSIARWNARLHYYLGLYLIFFIWLFALTGLLLNHGMWGMADFQRSRTTTKSEHQVVVPNTSSPLADAQELMRQLRVTGEIQWLGTPGQPNRFDFRVVRPGLQTEVRTDLNSATAVVEQTKTNALAITRLLHVFTGVRMNDPRNERDWILTKLWAFSMDAVAAGLLVMVTSGLWIWLQSAGGRKAGFIALTGGVLCCAWFVVGVRWFSE